MFGEINDDKTDVFSFDMLLSEFDVHSLLYASVKGNERFATEVDLAEAEIQDLQEQHLAAARDRDHLSYDLDVTEGSLDRTREALRQADEELGSMDPDPPSRHQHIDDLKKEKGRALTAADEAVRERTDSKRISALTNGCIARLDPS
ncbi:TKL protein kinase [Phytophthora cinnamomi]|uniref:TKL protein kinase n=1 Tax=Phytophthora cinnamomi TaxID=4785 RepID=UPI00355A486D|nr:TKL protein kinase [Phytophthora cinnamomi]